MKKIIWKEKKNEKGEVIESDEIQKFVYNVKEDDVLFLDKDIGANAFKNSSGIENVFSKSTISCISQSAFENCEELKNVDFSGDWKKEEDKKAEFLKNETPTPSFEIQYHAFKDCSKLESVVVPKCENLRIEKEAFANCTSLRVVVIDIENKNIEDTKNNTRSKESTNDNNNTNKTAITVSIADDAFNGVGDNLVFVSKNSDVQRFAREHGFKCISEYDEIDGE